MHRNFWLILWLSAAALLLAACGAPAANAPAADETVNLSELPRQLDVQTVADLRGRDDVILLDVREQWEYDEGHIPDITLIPMGELPNRLQEIPTDKTVIVTCRSGNRSGQVTAFLNDAGFDNVHNMSGGILAWEKAGLPVER